jgi:predicted lipoprotein with Yx(FWY)xxD motif
VAAVLPRNGRILIVLGVLAALAALASPALAGGPAPTVKTSANKALSKTVVVNPAGRTLYALSPETTHHLLCRESACLGLWPPLFLPHGAKLRAAKGVQGKLGLLRRSGGRMQVTLRGKPLYRYSGDGRAGEANGEGLQSFGGTWHAVTAATSAPPSSGTPATPAPSMTPPYEY